MSGRLYPSRKAYVAHDRAALQTCDHGLTRADCDLCTRYAGECDLGGCTRPGVVYGLVMRGETIRERRLICTPDIQFARDLGMRIVDVDRAEEWYDQVPEYQHVQWCQWAHISRWCPLGCGGDPTTYEAAVQTIGLIPS